MKKYTKVWLAGMGLWPCDVPPDVPCEYCNSVFVVDIHHIDPRGAGGSKFKDFFENLIGLCRPCHDMAESGEITQGELKRITENRHENTGN